jgi:5-methylcytosine-specific restriction endonuclease McrA
VACTLTLSPWTLDTLMQRPCIGCGSLIERGSRCGPCTPKRKTRDTAHAGTDWRWRKISEKLRRLSPFCEVPGCTSKDLTVDHIIPVSERPDLAKDELNCRVLCRSHNAARGTTCTDAERDQVLSAIKARNQRLASAYADQR